MLQQYSRFYKSRNMWDIQYTFELTRTLIYLFFQRIRLKRRGLLFNTQESVIDEKILNMFQNTRENKHRPTVKGTSSPLTELVLCSDYVNFFIEITKLLNNQYYPPTPTFHYLRQNGHIPTTHLLTKH